MFVSHEHQDHWKGAGPISRYCNCPIYMNELSYRKKESKMGRCGVEFMETSQEVTIEDLTIKHFSTRHDVKMSFGYSITQEDGPTFVYITDSGIVTPLIANYLSKADMILIEADYDVKMLDDYDGYDDYLKNRIMNTHLSNGQVMKFLEDNGVGKFQHVIFAHLSPRTNTPETILTLAKDCFPDHEEIFLTAPLQEEVEVKCQDR